MKALQNDVGIISQRRNKTIHSPFTRARIHVYDVLRDILEYYKYCECSSPVKGVHLPTQDPAIVQSCNWHAISPSLSSHVLAVSVKALLGYQLIAYGQKDAALITITTHQGKSNKTTQPT